MATFFQSFRSSSMPKKLLRYALARLELLDSEGLDMDNLDFAFGRNTVFEFRDVGIKLKKLEALLQLPAGLKMQKAKVLLLRVTIPMDFYTSPILVEVDGVDISLRVTDPPTTKRTPQAKTPEVIPNTVDLAQSFLETAPSSERRQLEEALAVESQDLGASVAASDEGSSEDESTFGTGQALSLPAFLADFLQGVVDRMQVRIKRVIFQLDVEVPVDPNSSNLEWVSFQIALDDVNIEGVTAEIDVHIEGETPKTKEGKRHISLNHVRAYLISEANVFSALARSSSTASPSMASSPAMTRNPPSRETTTMQYDNLRDATESLIQQQSLHEHLANSASSGSDRQLPLGDSEDALAIPYDFSDEDEYPEESPATPRASVHHTVDGSPDESVFHSTTLPDDLLLQQSDIFQQALSPPEDSPEASRQNLVSSLYASSSDVSASHLAKSDAQPVSPIGSRSGNSSSDDLAQSHLYTHEDAESMYMSAFSNTGPSVPNIASYMSPADDQHMAPGTNPQVRRPDDKSEQPEVSEQPESPVSPAFQEAIGVQESPESLGAEKTPESPKLSDHVESTDERIAEPSKARSGMPGGWDDESEVQESTHEQKTIPVLQASATAEPPLDTSGSKTAETVSPSEEAKNPNMPADDSESQLQEEPLEPDHGGATTPKGPTRLVKEIVALDNISIFLPSYHQHLHIQTTSAESAAQLSQYLGRSVYPQAPGGFSVHGQLQNPQMQDQDAPKSHTSDSSVEIDLSPIKIRFDASLGFLLAKVVARLMTALQQGSKPHSSQDTEQSSRSNNPDIRINLQELSLDFLNQLGGVADSPSRHLLSSGFMLDHEVLLNTTLRNMRASVSSKTQKDDLVTQTRVDIETFRFGYANGDIISFNKDQPMSTSLRDTFLSSGFDIGVKMTQIGKNHRTEIETLPLNVHVDLQRLDETFNWFGGLSSFLNMSSSMTSAHSPIIKAPAVPQAKPRGVRFQTTLDPEDRAASSENKINLKIGGALVELQGKECSVSAKSSSIKLVSREEGIRASISMLRVSGPLMRNSSADPAITANVSGIRLDYLMAPKDPDLEKLLELIIPSKVKFDQGNDEIMVDTLLNQRRKGSVLRASLDAVNVHVKNLAQLEVFPNLADEISKLSTVAKYLPEDDRPGLMTLGKVHKFGASIDFGGQLGHFEAKIDQLDVGHITVPSLLAVSTGGLNVTRNRSEELVSSSSVTPKENPVRSPVIMLRMIGDEIEPVVKIKLHNLAVEYRVPFVMDILGLAEDATPQDFEAGLAASVANLGEQAQASLRKQPAVVDKPKSGKPMTLDISFQECILGLNPLNLPSKMLVVLTDAHLEVTLPKDSKTQAVFDISKSSVLLIDDIEELLDEGSTVKSRRHTSSTPSQQVSRMCSRGFVDICYISSAKATLNIAPGLDGEQQVEVELRDDLLVLETCADSTQTMITLVNALKPPTPPSKEDKYRFEVMPMQDLLASISAEAFGKPEGEYDFDQDFAMAQEMAGSEVDAVASDDSVRFDTQYYGEPVEGEEMFDAMKASALSQGSTTMQDTAEGVLLTGFEPSSSAASESDDSSGLEIHDDFYAPGSGKGSSAKIWNSNRTTYDSAPESIVKSSPLKVFVRDVHFIWNLFDGYDWIQTRDVITKAVQEVESRAIERQSRGEGANVYEEEIEDEETIGDFLFNSIYIGIPANRNPTDLARAINQELNDNATETESVATTAFTGASNRTARPQKSKRLKLHRSRHHKITFELDKVNVDLFGFSDDAGETKSSIDVRVGDLDVFDHISTSTWKKFATYDQDMGEREMGTSMVHLEILNVKPMPDLPASEIVLRATLLPLRLHVDQDALDFITRFFEFKDDRAPVHASQSDVPFLQRAEVNNIPVKLDFKPKRVDYAGLRSGHTTEFMNFIVLEEARMVLRHVIIYGVPGFDRLGKTLNDLWMPDVRNNQLPGVIAGLAPVRSIVNIGSGFKDLVEIPMREYQKDGRVFRSISKGAAAFARTTGTEIVKLGAKLAVGTQYALQGAEDMLTNQKQPEVTWEEDDIDAEEKKQISLYADQPPSVLQGVRGGYRSLVRDVNLARDAIIAVPGEVMQSQSAAGAVKAVWKRTPTIIFRPAVGVTKAIGQTLMGATNTIDPQNQRRINEKYKKY